MKMGISTLLRRRYLLPSVLLGLMATLIFAAGDISARGRFGGGAQSDFVPGTLEAF